MTYLKTIALGLALAISATPAFAQAQRTSDDNPLLRVLEGVLTQVEPAQQEAQAAPAFPNSDCAVAKARLKDGGVIITCQQADEWGFHQFFVRTDGSSPSEKADQGGLALDMALAALNSNALVLNVHYASGEVPPVRYCSGSLDNAPNNCREVRTLSLRRAP